MRDRLLFVTSRFLWPANNVVLIVVIGLIYGQAAIADYTYALAVCAPLYFLASLSFPMFVAVRNRGRKLGRELLWFRLATVVATLPLAALGLLAHTTQSNVTMALWIVRIGDILFEPVAMYIATGRASMNRGVQLFLSDGSRVVVSQMLLWLCILVLKEGLVVVLLVVGAGNVIVGLVYLLLLPEWRHHRVRRARLVATLRRMLRAATPMTASGGFLALLIGLPRLLNEPFLAEHEKAIFGVAQVAGSGIALVFNAGWLYELSRIKETVARQDFRGVLRINGGLSLSYLGLMLCAAVVLGFIQWPLFTWFKVTAPVSLLLPVLVFVLGLQHCISVHRDVLKLSGQLWTEVGILTVSLSISAIVHYAAALWFDWPWTVNVASMCIAAAAVQVGLSYIAISRKFQLGGRETLRRSSSPI